MRLIRSSLLTCALAVVCAAQAVVSASPGVTVYGFDWRTRYRTERSSDYGLERRRGDLSRSDPLYREQLRRRGVWESDPNRLEMPSPATRRPARRVPYGYESSVHLKNTGAKAIRAVEWEHVFYEDKEKRSEQKRFKFRREAKIEPGEQKFVSQAVTTDARAKLANRPRQSVEITRIDYADGSAWQRR